MSEKAAQPGKVLCPSVMIKSKLPQQHFPVPGQVHEARLQGRKQENKRASTGIRGEGHFSKNLTHQYRLNHNTCYWKYDTAFIC